MQSAPLGHDEALRLSTLNALEVLDTPADPVLDGLVRVAVQVIGCPIALVSLVDEKRQWFKARQGLDAQQTSRELAFCAHAVLQSDLFEVCDARTDERFCDNPLVTGEPHMVFYAGVPLRVDGHALGTLCVIDHRPRELTEGQRSLLQDLARTAEHWLLSQQTFLRLQRADNDLRHLFNQMGDGVLLVDRNYRVIDVNRAAARMLAHRVHELHGMQLHDLLPVTEHSRFARTARCVLTGDESMGDWQVLRGDGSSFMAEVSTRLADHERFVVVIRDITQRHAQEQEVRLLSMAVEQSAQSILITDLDARIQYANVAALRSSGYTLQEMVGRNPRILQSGATPRETYDQMWGQLQDGKPWRGLLFNRRKDGVEYVEDATITPIRDACGRVTQYLSLMLDVTEKRRLHDELERHQLHLEDLVEQRTEELVEARRTAEAASDAKSAFLAAMSHEIRTPMNGVVGSVELLQRSELSPYQRDLADTVRESTQALLSVIDDILDFSKIEAGFLTLLREPVSIVQLTDNVYDSLRAVAASRSVSVQVEVDPQLPHWILSDARRMRQILSTLLSNAIQFSTDIGRPGCVKLQVQACGPELPGHLQLSVIDNGIGMDPDALKCIFKPFALYNSAAPSRLGFTELGLSICQRVVSTMEGWIEVASEKDRGSRFNVTLPFEPAEEPQRSDDDLDTDRPPACAGTGPRFAAAGGPLVLVAEDNGINQKVIGHQLALLGVAVEMVDNGLEALARWRAGRVTQRHTLLLIDLHMPGIDGYALAATIRSEEADGARVPIIALSANALQGESDRCRSAGMDDYLTKPVQTSRLGEMLERWLPRDDRNLRDSLECVECEEVDVFDVELNGCAYDEHALASLVGDDPVVLADFRRHFMLSALNTMDELRRCASMGNFAGMADLAHRLKSSARTIGAASLGTCCERIERSAPEGVAMQMHGHMIQMEDALAHVMTRLSEQTGQMHSGDVA